MRGERRTGEGAAGTDGGAPADAARTGAKGPAEEMQTAPEGAAGGVIFADFCIIGGGSGGLALAVGAAAFGQKAVLIEKHRMGGDRLNYGGIPSKALLAAAKRAHIARSSQAFGILADPQVNYQAVHDHVGEAVASAAPEDSTERYTGLGVRVIQAAAQFAGRNLVTAGNFRIEARRFVIATGSSPFVPPVPGLDSVPYFTNETIFDAAERPAHLAIIGGGPAGLEFAQAFRRLGSRVTVLEADRALAGADPELAAAVLARLRAEGIGIREGASVARVEGAPGRVRLHIPAGEGTETIEASHLLVAAGRVPNTAGLNLEAAGIVHGPQGIKVNRGLRTSNPRVFAIGDVTGGPHATHAACYHAGIVLRRTLFWLPSKAEPRLVPQVTFTDPELAEVGLSEEDARRAYGRIGVLRAAFRDNSRALAERETDGHIKVITRRNGRILGAAIVGAHAGEIIHVWALAVSRGLNISAFKEYVAPYPTYSEINRSAALRFSVTAASSPLVRKLVAFLARFG